MKRALLHMKEGVALWTRYCFAWGALIPSYCCSPIPLGRPFKQLLCQAPRNESICWCVCSSPGGDAEQQHASSVQLAERKQLISLFLCLCQYVCITIMGPCWYPQVANLHEISCLCWALNNILGSLVKKVADGFYTKDWKFRPCWDCATAQKY